jgi:hypothetical protein
MRSALNLGKHSYLIEINHINLLKLIFYFFNFSVKNYSLFKSEKQQILVQHFPLLLLI